MGLNNIQGQAPALFVVYFHASNIDALVETWQMIRT
tara:strand:+ start:95 stop:202 length:108 start_codon:yes stop_codon:yes gene_type:complete